MSVICGYEVHDAADVFPLLSGDELDDLRDNIRRHGFNPAFPIVRHGGKILDGRNRLRAAHDVGVEPLFVEWNGEYEDPWSYVFAVNVVRRHLHPSERAMAVIRFNDKMLVLAKQRSEANLKQGKRRISPDGKKSSHRADTPTQPNRTNDKLAKMAHVSSDSVKRAKRIKKADPDLAAKVAAGETTLAEAERQIGRKPKKTGPRSPKKAPPRVDRENAIDEIDRRIAKLAKQLTKSWPDHATAIARALRRVAKEISV